MIIYNPSSSFKEPAMKRVFQLLFFLLITVLFTPLVSTGTDTAEIEKLMDMTEEIDEAPGYEDPKDEKRDWALSIGVIAGVTPDYEGSDDYDFGFGPNLAGSWRDILFFKGKTFGANLIRKKNLKAGPILSWSGGRDEDDNDKLEGLGDVDGSIEAGGFVSYRKKPLRFKLEARQDVNSGHEGALVELSVGANLPFKKPLVSVALGTTWASDDYMESFFGISSTQSANSGLKTYDADAGIKDISLSMTAGYPLTNRWRLGGKVEYKRLVGDAADSPVVEDENQFLAGIGISYHFGSKVRPDDLKE
jgi:outer membrane scaffolding protein for murein synthesis (MipA/OmpV family)